MAQFIHLLRHRVYILYWGCFLVTIKISQAPVPIFKKLVLSIIKILLKLIPVHSQSQIRPHIHDQNLCHIGLKHNDIVSCLELTCNWPYGWMIKRSSDQTHPSYTWAWLNPVLIRSNAHSVHNPRQRAECWLLHIQICGHVTSCPDRLEVTGHKPLNANTRVDWPLPG